MRTGRVDLRSDGWHVEADDKLPGGADIGDSFSAAASGNASRLLSRVKTALLRLSCQSAAAFGSPRSPNPGSRARQDDELGRHTSVASRGRAIGSAAGGLLLGLRWRGGAFILAAFLVPAGAAAARRPHSRDGSRPGNRLSLRSMIPHHSGALTVCRRASLRDPQVVNSASSRTGSSTPRPARSRRWSISPRACEAGAAAGGPGRPGFSDRERLSRTNCCKPRASLTSFPSSQERCVRQATWP